jgi:hypothetical protein
MEDENDLMSMFDSGMELNYEGFAPYSEEDEEEELDDTIQNKPVEEEVPENVDGDEDDDGEGDDSGDESSPNIYSSLAGVLFEQGIIPSLESSEKIQTPDDLVGVVKQEIDLQAQIRLEEYLANLDVSKIAASRQNINDLESIDEDYLRENLEVAKEIIYRDALNQGLSEDRARKILKKTIDLGEDTIIEDALESKESLKEFERRQEEQEKVRYQEAIKAQKAEQEQIDNAIKNYIFDTPEIVKGVPNTKALQTAVYKTMTEIVGKNPGTGEFENKLMKERSLDPIKFDTKMYYFYELTNGFTELGKFQANVTSKATKSLEKALRKTNFEDNGTPGYMTDPNSYNGSFGSELVL